MKYNILDRRRRSVYSTNNSTLPLIIKWQSTPRSRIKLFKILNPTCSVYTIVLCPELENASNDTVTGLNWVPGTDKIHRQSFRFLNEFCIRNTLLQTKDKIQETSGKTGSYHYCSLSLTTTKKKCLYLTTCTGLASCVDSKQKTKKSSCVCHACTFKYEINIIYIH